MPKVENFMNFPGREIEVGLARSPRFLASGSVDTPYTEPLVKKRGAREGMKSPDRFGKTCQDVEKRTAYFSNYLNYILLYMNALTFVFLVLLFLSVILIHIAGLRAGLANWKLRDWDAKVDPIGYAVYWKKEKNKWTIIFYIMFVLIVIFGSLASYFSNR